MEIEWMDFEQINELLGLASSAVGFTGKATNTIAAIKELFENDKTPNNGAAAELLNTLATQLTAANMTNLDLSQALKVLSQELHRQDEFEREKARYALFQTGENDMVFQLRQDAANGQPIHFICPVCLNRDKLISFITGDQYEKFCQSDKSHRFSFAQFPYDSGVNYI